ncbi:MAG: hypothetical protein RLZZ511_4401 [Cyanobacteriota bacterium]|jgi:hypothetical protein
MLITPLKQIDDALKLIIHCEDKMPELEDLYDRSLSREIIENSLLIEIKNVYENLRSALDFLAQALVSLYSQRKPKRIYFPYANLKTAQQKFEVDLKNAIPDLEVKNPTVYSIMIEIQHFHPNGFAILPKGTSINRFLVNPNFK